MLKKGIFTYVNDIIGRVQNRDQSAERTLNLIVVLDPNLNNLRSEAFLKQRDRSIEDVTENKLEDWLYAFNLIV